MLKGQKASAKARAAIKAGHAARGLDAAGRFWIKVEKRGPDECWNWTGNINKFGYGTFWYGGRVCRAPRVVLMLQGMVLPDRKKTGLVVDHICRNRACVNPAHLRIVSQVDNCGSLANPTPHFTNKTKTHCTPGHHPLSGDNLHWIKNARGLVRVCLTCQRMRRPGCTWQPNTRETARVVAPRFTSP